MGFIEQWFGRPSWVATVSIVGGALLIVLGIATKRRQDQLIGLVVIVLGTIAGVLLYIYS